MVQCTALCKNGQQCKRMLKAGTVCKTHFKGECSICLECIDDEKTKTTCGHYFHKSCLNTWLQKHNTCPVCRTQISKSTMITYRISIYPDTLPEMHFDVDIIGDGATNVDLVVEAFYDILIQDDEFKQIVSNKEPYRLEIFMLN